MYILRLPISYLLHSFPLVMNTFMPTAGLRADYTIRLIQIYGKALTPLQSGIDLAISEVTSDLGLTLKPKQEICLQKFASGRDVFVSLPTGYGKSLYSIAKVI